MRVAAADDAQAHSLAQGTVDLRLLDAGVLDLLLVDLGECLAFVEVGVEVAVNEAAEPVHDPVEGTIVLTDDGLRIEPGAEQGVGCRRALFAEDRREGLDVFEEPVAVTAIRRRATLRRRERHEAAGLIEDAPHFLIRLPDLGDAGAVGEELPAGPVEPGDVPGPPEIVGQRAMVEHHPVQIAPVQTEGGSVRLAVRPSVCVDRDPALAERPGGAGVLGEAGRRWPAQTDRITASRQRPRGDADGVELAVDGQHNTSAAPRRRPQTGLSDRRPRGEAPVWALNRVAEAVGDVDVDMDEGRPAPFDGFDSDLGSTDHLQRAGGPLVTARPLL